jgi:hypothetical protein
MKRSPPEWVSDAAVVEQIGRHLDEQMPLEVKVRLPRAVALAAIESWNREENTAPLPADESPDERRVRRRSGLLGLIGNWLSSVELGESDEILVMLPAHLVGRALYEVWDSDLERRTD